MEQSIWITCLKRFSFMPGDCLTKLNSATTQNKNSQTLSRISKGTINGNSMRSKRVDQEPMLVKTSSSSPKQSGLLIALIQSSKKRVKLSSRRWRMSEMSTLTLTMSKTATIDKNEVDKFKKKKSI